MSETMPPGSDLDAKLAMALGWTYVGLSEVAGCYEGEPPAGTDRWYQPARVPRRLDQHVGIPQFSTDLATIVSTAEEARAAGKIKWWSLNSPTAADPSWDAQAGTGAFDHEFSSIGSRVSGAHALALALLTACGGAA